MDATKATAGDAAPTLLENVHPYTTMKEDKSGTLPPPATYTGRRYRRRRVTIIGCCTLLLLLLLTLGVVILVHWLVLQPKQGNYDLTDASLTIVNVTHVTETSRYELDAVMNLAVAFGNPNGKAGFDIKGITVRALYAGDEIAQAELPPFYQPRKNDTVVSAQIRAAKRVVLAGAALQGEVQRGNVTFQVVMNAKVRRNHGMLESLHPFHGIRLTCFVSLMAPGRVMNGTTMISKSCAVKR